MGEVCPLSAPAQEESLTSALYINYKLIVSLESFWLAAYICFFFSLHFTGHVNTANFEHDITVVSLTIFLSCLPSWIFFCSFIEPVYSALWGDLLYKGDMQFCFRICPKDGILERNSFVILIFSRVCHSNFVCPKEKWLLHCSVYVARCPLKSIYTFIYCDPPALAETRAGHHTRGYAQRRRQPRVSYLRHHCGHTRGSAGAGVSGRWTFGWVSTYSAKLLY